MTRSRTFAAVAACALGASLLGVAVHENNKPPTIVTVHASEAFPLDDAASATAWADDVFVARVTSAGENRTVSGDIPVTLFHVEVLATPKGKVRGHVKVAQSGGIDKEPNEQVVVDGVVPLTSGSTYLFTTRASSRGFHMIPTGHPAELVTTSAASAISAWTAEAAKDKPNASISDHPSEVENSTPAQAETIYQSASDA